MDKQTVIKHFGSQIAVARALGLSKSTISEWPDPIPEGQAWKLQVLTGGKLQVDQSVYRKLGKSKI
jgi:hypothetical protein